MRIHAPLLSLSLALSVLPVLHAQEVDAVAPDITWGRTRNFGQIPSIKLSELRGSVVVLEFWLTYDQSHKDRGKVRDALQAKYLERGLVVIGLTPEKMEDVVKDLEKHPVEHPIAVGEYPGYDVKLVPTTIVIDKEGKVAWRGRSEQLPEGKLVTLLNGARAAYVRKGLDDVHALRKEQKFGEAWQLLVKLLDEGNLSPAAHEQGKGWRIEMETFVKESMAAADEAEKDKDAFGMWRQLDPVASSYQGIPGAEKAKERLDALMADKKNVREIDAGKEFGRAAVAEASFDFDTAIGIYDTLAKRHSATRAGKASKDRHKELMKRGMLGYQHDCVYCKAGEKACPTHARKR